ncbi:MAG: DoxX family protein [Rhodothermus sp.]|nr:DoxX family protein [Rhodothermus sp.]
MRTPNELRAWIEAHRLLGYDLIRMYLGIALFVRGWLFVADASRIMAFVEGQKLDWFLPMAAVHYVALAHLAGGLMLAVGLLTRLAALVQVPILFVATFFLHLQEGLLSTSQSLELSALVLFLLVVYSIFGAGPYSLDAHMLTKASAQPLEAQRA